MKWQDDKGEMYQPIIHDKALYMALYDGLKEKSESNINIRKNMTKWTSFFLKTYQRKLYKKLDEKQFVK